MLSRARHFVRFCEYKDEIDLKRMESAMRQPERVFERSTALYESHAPAILAYLLRQVGSREEAEDLLLEVFTLLLEKEATLHTDERSVRAWLLTVARNKVVDHYRHASRL